MKRLKIDVIGKILIVKLVEMKINSKIKIMNNEKKFFKNFHPEK